MVRVVLCALAMAVGVLGAAADAGGGARLVTPADDLGIPYDRFEVVDMHGRVVTFYLSANDGEDRPLVIAVQGSGCASVFLRTGDRVAASGIHGMLHRGSGGRVRLLVVEKPGVEFLDRPTPPGTGDPCTDEFKREMTRERWGDALVTAARAASALPGVDASRVLVVGHSEGAVVAVRVGAEAPDAVTHAAALSGSGVAQLFDLALLASREREPGEDPESRQARLDGVYETWSRIAEDPGSIEQSAWGHPYRKWSSFAPASVLNEALRLRPETALLIAHGTEDEASPIESFDVMRAELIARGREVVVIRVPGADHGFRREGDEGWEGFARVLEDVTAWFLTE